MRRRRRRLMTFALVSAAGAAAWLSPPARGQEVETTPQYRSNRPYESEVEAANPPPSRFHVSGGVDLRDQYFFRGYLRDSSGLIVQPYFDLAYTIYQDERVAITPHAGAWFDISETKGPEVPKHFNEFRPTGGVAIDTAGFTLDVLYAMYKSPSELFGRSQEYGANLSYHDRWLWPAGSPIAAVNPSVSFYREFEDDKDGDNNSYFEVRFEPEVRRLQTGLVPVTFSFPVVFGGSWDGYYVTDRGGTAQAGYWMAGIKAAVPLTRPGDPVRCNFEVEADYIRLMADSAERANGGDNDDVMVRFGFALQL